MSEKQLIKLAQVLQEAIEQSRLTLREISNRTGVSVSTLTDWQSGRLPSDPIKLRRVAHFFGLSLHEIFFGTKDPLEARVPKEWIIDELEKGSFEIILRRI